MTERSDLIALVAVILVVALAVVAALLFPLDDLLRLLPVHGGGAI